MNVVMDIGNGSKPILPPLFCILITGITPIGFHSHHIFEGNFGLWYYGFLVKPEENP
jgi:hypothetical protein